MWMRMRTRSPLNPCINPPASDRLADSKNSYASRTRRSHQSPDLGGGLGELHHPECLGITIRFGPRGVNGSRSATPAGDPIPGPPLSLSTSSRRGDLRGVDQG